MFRIHPPTPRHLVVTTVTDDLTTILELSSYFGRRVSHFRAVPVLEAASSRLACSDAVLFYPDGFPRRPTQRFLSSLIASKHDSLVIIITACPERYPALSGASVTTDRLIVLQAPVWPWELYAAIHAVLPPLSQRRRARLS
jgi:hypothetical protein